jgi:hypothetical protein
MNYWYILLGIALATLVLTVYLVFYKIPHEENNK